MPGQFSARIVGRYSPAPEILDGEVFVEYHSDRPEKRRAELAVLHALFRRFVAAEDERLALAIAARDAPGGA